jgi:hypothetical protein
MPISKEDIRRKYDITDEGFDILQALALHPTCEYCNKSLPPDSIEARICSFRCTFCATCAEKVLGNVCPNCGGEFSARPIRPSRNGKDGNLISGFPGAHDPEA